MLKLRQSLTQKIEKETKKLIVDPIDGIISGPETEERKVRFNDLKGLLRVGF